MGVDLSTYRARIGCFSNPGPDSLHCWAEASCLLVWLVMSQLMLKLAGDVEENPGPVHSNKMEKPHHGKKIQSHFCQLRSMIIDAQHIKGYLYDRGILNENDLAKINSKTTPHERVEQLLYIITRKDEAGYQSFLQSLKEEHEGVCLYMDVVELLEGADPEQGTQSAEQDEERSQWNLVQDSRKDIAERLDAGKACEHLVNGHILTEEESDAINAEETPLDRASSLLRVLPAKGPNAFSALCRVLHHQGLEEIASFLNGASASDALKPVTNVPKPVNNFLQTTDATNVQQALTDNKSITIVSGICKLGKTQIARWVASQFLKHHPTAVVWVLDGQSCQTFLSSERRLLAALNAEVPEEEDTTKVDECLDKALKDRGTPVLLIVDDLEDAALLTPTLLRERIQSRVMVLTHQKDLRLPAEVRNISHSLSISGFSNEEVEMYLQKGDLDKPDKQEYQGEFLLALNEAFNRCPLTWAVVRQFTTVSHTSLENYVAELSEGKTLMDIQEELTFLRRWMYPQYEKFDPVEESLQLTKAISKLSSTSRESTDKTSSDGLFMYGITSPQTEHPQAPDHQTNKREDSATPLLENKDSHETSPSFQAAVVVEEKHETSLDEDDKDETPDDTASAQCQEVPPCQMTVLGHSDAHSAAHHQDITQPKGRLPTACIEGGIEVEGAVGGTYTPYSAQTVSNSGRPNTPCPDVQNVRRSLSFEGDMEAEGAVGGRCSPYSAQTVSQNETTSNCNSSRSNIPCPEVQNVRRAFNLSIYDSWDLVHEHSEQIARRLIPRLACRFLFNANVLTEYECSVINAEETRVDRATILLNILKAKDQNALLAFCAALAEQRCEDIAALITGRQVSNILSPVTNVPKPVNNFVQTRDANQVRAAVMDRDQYITVVWEIPGSGKTQIARWVAGQCLKRHPTAVVWVLDGQNSQTFLASKRRLLVALNAEVPEEEDTTKVDECLDKALKDRGTPVLLIMEDLQDAALLTPTLLRERIQSRVMILTHQEDLELQLPEGALLPCILQVEEGFQTWDGIRFFQTVLGETDYQEDHLQCLTDVFDGRPLGLAAALGYMHNTHTSPEQYMLMLKEEKTAKFLQQQAARFMSQHYTKFDQGCLHPVFQAAQNKLRPSRDTSNTDEVRPLEQGFQYGFAVRVQDEEDEERRANEDEPLNKMSYPDASAHFQSPHGRLMGGDEEGQTQQSEEAVLLEEEPVAGHRPGEQDTERESLLTTSSEDSCFLQTQQLSTVLSQEDALASHPQDEQYTERRSLLTALSGDSFSMTASVTSAEEITQSEEAVSTVLSQEGAAASHPPDEQYTERRSLLTTTSEDRRSLQTLQPMEAVSSVLSQEGAVASHPQDDRDTESTTSSGDGCSLGASVISTEEGSELEGAVGGIYSPPRSRTASQPGLPRALAISIPPPNAHLARFAVPCQQVQQATRIVCQLLRLQQPGNQQQVEGDMSSSGPPAFVVLENQEFPVLPASSQFVQEQTFGTVLVYSHPAEQRIATERGHPQQFLWEIAVRNLTEVFDHNLESNFTFRYYVPRRPPDSLPFVPLDARIGTGTTVQAVAATDGASWAWRITSTQDGPELEIYLESSHIGACGNHQMTTHVEPAGQNHEHRSWRNSPLQQGPSPIVVPLEAERQRLLTHVGQGSISVRVQRGDGAQIVQEIIDLYLGMPSAAACRLNVEFIGEFGIDCGGPGRELFMLVWRWLSERCLVNGIPCQSPNLEPSSYEFWLAVGRFALHMFLLYDRFPAVHLARYVVEAMFNGPQQLDSVNWLIAFLDTLPTNMKILLLESCSDNVAFERNREHLTEMLMMWGVSSFPQSPAHLTQIVPRIGRSVCLDLPYVALCGLINGFREGWQGRVMPGDVDSLIGRLRHPTSWQDIIPALKIDASNVDSNTGHRMLGYLNEWLQNARPEEIQQLLITTTGCDQLTGEVITIVFDPGYPNNAISTCAQTWPVPVVESYEDFCIYMTGVLSGNTFNHV